MATHPLVDVLQSLRTTVLPRPQSEVSDGELLTVFLDTREEAAFAALVHRHGPMVWGVCRRHLLHHQDAEDAFQATFLVLVRKARCITPRDMVANWLYGVAHQTALKARATMARRRVREKLGIGTPEPAVEDQLFEDLQPLLDQELRRLPEKLRAAVVLCDLEGKTRKEAARHMRVPEGTVASRLATARSMLAKRLARRGLTATTAAVGAMLSQTASARVPPVVAAGVVRVARMVAAGQAPASLNAVVLAEAVIRSMLLSKLKLVATILMAITLLFSGTVALTQQIANQKPTDPSAEAVDQRESDALENAPIWPQWRGPNRDGIVRGVTIPEKWPKELTEEWKATVGDGVASPVVVGGSVYVFTRQNDDERVICLDVDSGRQKWRSESYAAPYKVGPGEGDGGNRPRSTPVFADGRIFTLGMTGILTCLDTRTGKLLWRKDTKYTYYGGSSPLVTDGLCIVHCGDGTKTGGLMAFGVHSGELKWSFSDGYCAMSGSPVVVDLAGERHLVTYSAWNAAGVSLATGQKLWGVGPAGGGMPCTTPVQYKDLLILADNMDSLRALRLEKGSTGITAKEVWKAKGLPLYYSSPVAADGLVFGMSTRSGGCLFCLDANTGATRWVTDGRMGGHASILHAGRVVLFLTDRGRLLVVKPNGTAFQPVAEYRVSDGATEAHPVLLGDRILVKDQQSLTCLRISRLARTTERPRTGRERASDADDR
jgi:RNA polymerase sigma factor (sigma-70 family)